LGYKFALAYGVILALLSFISDVSVSLFKRNAGVKDASDVLPGHGGVLDRMDSYILTAPVVYMFWTLVSKQIETL
jgi:phosphatidate cytidylyltransferase